MYLAATIVDEKTCCAWWHAVFVFREMTQIMFEPFNVPSMYVIVKVQYNLCFDKVWLELTTRHEKIEFAVLTCREKIKRTRSGSRQPAESTEQPAKWPAEQSAGQPAERLAEQSAE